MIFFATCGRGIENFATKELSEFRNVCEAKIIAEGKLIFCLCDKNENEKKYNDYIIYKDSKTIETFSSCICDCENIQSITLQKYSFKEIDEILLLNLKLVEKVFYLVYFQSLSSLTDSKKYSDNLVENLVKLNFESAMQRISIFKQLRKDPLWTPCANPGQCFAFLTRQEEKEKNFKRRSRKRKMHEGHESLKTNKQKLDTNTVSAQTNQTESVCCSTENKIKSVLTTESCQNTFRVSCRIRGKWKEYYKPFTLSKALTDSILKSNSTWTAVTDTPLMDIYINMNDDCVIVGVPLTDKPLSLRPYIPHIALRSTICHLMVREANIEEGDTVLDPMCGVGTLLLEAATNINKLRVIAGDNCTKTLTAAQCNLRALTRKDFILSECSNLPLMDNCIDAILCDFPFGKKHLVESYRTLLLKMFSESARVLRVSSRLVVLVSSTQYSYIKEILLNGIKLLGSYPVSLGLTNAHILTFEKTP